MPLRACEETYASPSPTARTSRSCPSRCSPATKNLYDLPPAELSKIPTVCGSLREALQCLDKDRAFLKAGGVSTDLHVDVTIQLEMAETARDLR